MSLKTRFTCFFSLVTILLLVLFSSAVYIQARYDILSQAEKNLIDLVNHEWDHLELPAHQAKAKRGVPHFREIFIRIIKNGVTVFDSFPITIEEPTQNGLFRNNDQLYFSTLKNHNGHEYRIVAYSDLNPIFSHLVSLQRTLIIACLLSLFIVIPLSLTFTKILLFPFRKLAAQASQINADHLSFRFSESRSGDEYAELAKNFNILLASLEKSFTKTSRFAVNASHELKTPLSVIISQGEMLMRKAATLPPDAVSAVEKMLGRAKTLREITHRLFLLSEIDRVDKLGKGEVVNVQKAVSDVVNAVQLAPVYSDRKVSLTCPANLEVVVNKDLFSSIVTNLVENAFKYSAQKIHINCENRIHQIRILIEDDGPGIPEEKRELVFEPFIRITKEKQGHGLGLSIVKSCVEAVKGSIRLNRSSLGGLQVVLALPT